MCEFCVKHGDGKKWYLNAANYAEEMLADVRRQKYIEDFIPEVSSKAARWLRIMDRGLRVSPGVTRRAADIQSRRMKRIHFGQVIPLEDVRAVLETAGQAARVACVCREVLQKRQEGVCYLLSVSPERLGLVPIAARRPEAAPYIAGLEKVGPARALAEMEALEDRRMIHTVWTFVTPWIGAICNCDPAGCLAINFTARGLRLYFPGEWEAAVDPSRCTACGGCLDMCLFGAVSRADGAVTVDRSLCHGCGICRRACPEGAVSLRPRAETARQVP